MIRCPGHGRCLALFRGLALFSCLGHFRIRSSYARGNAWLKPGNLIIPDIKCGTEILNFCEDQFDRAPVLSEVGIIMFS